jgi:hypothetical protein
VRRENLDEDSGLERGGTITDEFRETLASEICGTLKRRLRFARRVIVMEGVVSLALVAAAIVLAVR